MSRLSTFHRKTMRFRIATFNVENLFARLDFGAFEEWSYGRRVPPVVGLLERRERGDQSGFDEWKSLYRAATVAQDDDKRQLTSLALARANADVVCLQEVDDVVALRRFRDHYVHRTTSQRYQNLVLHEGNDGRGIDVAAMTTREFPPYSRSHASTTGRDLREDRGLEALLERYPKAKTEVAGEKGSVFRRDCLELEFRWGGGGVTVYVCHFKSMYGGAGKTVGTRQMEALAVRRLIEARFDDPASEDWLVVGDLNDYRSYVLVDRDGNGETLKRLRRGSGVDPLLDGGFSVNVVEERDADDQWTHYYGRDRHKTQLDYILASPQLAARLAGRPEIVRGGQPHRVPDSASRFPRVGWDRPKASDHCPVIAEFEFPDAGS